MRWKLRGESRNIPKRVSSIFILSIWIPHAMPWQRTPGSVIRKIRSLDSSVGICWTKVKNCELAQNPETQGVQFCDFTVCSFLRKRIPILRKKNYTKMDLKTSLNMTKGRRYNFKPNRNLATQSMKFKLMLLHGGKNKERKEKMTNFWN